MAENSSPRVYSHSNTCILIVEDDRVCLSLLEAQVEKLGYKYMSAENGLDAKALIEKHHKEINVILLDQEIPEISGIELVKIIKANSIYAKIPIIMQTGTEDKDFITKCIDAGVFYYLHKPIQEELLSSVIKSALKEYKYNLRLLQEKEGQTACISLIDECKYSFKTMEEAENLAYFIANSFPDPGKVIIGLVEIFYNSIEHGNIGITYDEKTKLIDGEDLHNEIARRLNCPKYKDKYTEVYFKRTDTYLMVRIKDMGQGFDWRKYLEVLPDRILDNHGRGVAQANSMSFDEVIFNELGNEVSCYSYINSNITSNVNLQDNDEHDEIEQLKSQFLSTLSHEIRTPMNGIMGMTELLLSSNLSKKQERFAQTVMNSSEDLLQIIDDMLDFSRLEKGNLKLNNQVFSLDAIGVDLVQLTRIKLKDKPVEVSYFYDPNLSDEFIGDNIRISQVISNFLTNALKFTDKGNIYLTITKHPENDNLLRIKVEDSGFGISKSNQKKLFEKFRQIDGSNTRKFGGTGLGLAISKKLAELMGGDVNFESEIGKGSKFWVDLNLKTISKAKTNKLRFPEGTKIYLYEPNKYNLQSIKLTCEYYCAEVIILNEAKDILDQISSTNSREHALCVFDYKSTKLYFQDYTRKLKQRPDNEFIHTFIMDAEFLNSDIEEIKSAGFNGILLKPFSRDEIIEIVDHYNTNFSNHSNFFVTRLLSNEGNTKGGILFENVNIHLAEDNRINQEFAREIFTSLGCQITISSNGEEAVNYIKNNHQNIDLIMMDVYMPIMNGFVASEEINNIFEVKKTKHIPIVAITGLEEVDEKQKCLQHGMVDVVNKPMRKNALKKILLKYLPQDKIIFRRNATKNYLLKNKKILVAEDNKINREYVLQILEDVQCQSEYAVNGKEAFEKFKTNQYDIIFMDIQMPEMDGIEATKLIRQYENDNETARIPIIALTANAMKGDDERCFEVGMNDYLSKPAKIEQIERVIKKWTMKGSYE